MENKVIEFYCLQEPDHWQLSHVVSKMIKEGWQPFGNVESRYPDGKLLLIMVKYDNTELPTDRYDTPKPASHE